MLDVDGSDSMEGHGLLVRALGPLAVSRSGREVPVPKAQVRCALAVLSTHVDQVVSSDALIDAIWGGQPPPSSHHGLHVVMSDLRSVVDGEPCIGRVHLVSQSPGYRLALSDGEFDVRMVDDLVAAARSCAQDQQLEEAETQLIAAEAMWHGPPYAEFTYAEFAQREIGRLTELRLQVIEDRIATQLALGKHREVIAELEGLVAENPTRERFLRSLMVALNRSNRPVEALGCFEDARRRLKQDYGLDTSPATVRLAESIRTVPWSPMTVR
jgi:DNA-binding SARP family transcriptional activator